MLCGCPKRPIDFGKDGEPRDAADLLMRVRMAELSISSVKGEAKLKASSERGSGTAGLFVAVLEPADGAPGPLLRLEALDFFGRPQAQLISDGQRFGLYDAQAGKYFQGPASAANLSRVLPVTMPPAELAALLLGRVPRVSDEPQMTFDAERGVFVVTLGRQTVEIEPPSYRVVKSAVPGSYAVEMSDVQATAGTTFPWRSALEASGTRMELAWKDVELNVPPEDSMFDMAPPEGVPVVEVDPYGNEVGR